MPKRRESSTVQQNASKKAKQQQIPLYKVIKNKLSNVVEDDETSLKTIQNIVIAVHHLSIYTLDFLKAYLLYNYDQQVKHALPVIDENLIKNIMTVLCEKTDKDKRSCASRLKKETQELKAHLGEFYEAHFQELGLEAIKRLNEVSHTGLALCLL